MENPLLVFVSSAIEEFKIERAAIRKTIKSIEVTRPWVFEFTPASSEPLKEAYLKKVEECDIFLLLLGRELPTAVEAEYQLAAKTGKPILAFLKETARSPQAERLERQIPVKWMGFADARRLHVEVKEAVIDELIKGYRKGVHVTTSRASGDSTVLSPSGLEVGGSAGAYTVVPPTPVTRMLASYYPGTVAVREILQLYAGGYVTKLTVDASGKVSNVCFYRDGLPTKVVFDAENRIIRFSKGPVWKGGAIEVPFGAGPSEKGKWWLRLPSKVVSQTNGIEYSMGQQKAFISQEFTCEEGHKITAFINPLEPEDQRVEVYLFRNGRQVQPNVDWDLRCVSFPLE